MTAYPEFRQTRCTRYRFRYSSCRRCADACPHDALVLSEDGAAVDQTRCQNCALCASVCRTEAWVADKLPRVDLLKAAVKQTAFSFACAPSGEPADAVVPCLGALDAAMLAYAVKRGVQVELRGSMHCADCAHGSRGEAQLRSSLEGLDLLQEAARDAGERWAEVRVRHDRPRDERADERHLSSRRQLFRRLLGRGAAELTRRPSWSGLPPDRAIRAGAPFLSEQRELLDLVGRTAGGSAFGVPAHAALPLESLRLDEGCNGCGACFRACPTAAIEIRETDSAWGLLFHPQRCVGCGVCAEVCQPRVFMALDNVELSAKGAVTLHAMQKQRCTRCDRFFVARQAGEVCPTCLDDDDAFAAIFG